MKDEPHIVFVTTSNLATNPRLVKELELAFSLSYKVTVIAFHFENWSSSINSEIKKGFENKMRLIEISAERKPFLTWTWSSGLQIAAKVLAKLGVKHPFILSQALQKRSILLLYALKKIAEPVHLLVAHNPGSFFPVQRYAKKWGAPYGIDVEDYHPGETNDQAAAGWMRKLMQQTMKQADYITAAAPLILEEIKNDCKDQLPFSTVVLNYFSSSEFQPPKSSGDAMLKLVWFSQHIAQGRGLELLVQAVKEFPGSVELHLYGELNTQFEKRYLSDLPHVIVHTPLPQQLLHKELAMYDVGIALEDAASNYNREICITNKLLAYHQSGLYILASDTKAQKAFLAQHPQHGQYVSTSVAELIGAIQNLLNRKWDIRSGAAQRFNAAAAFSADNEVSTIKKFWISVFSGSVNAV
jgi:hypothetical protein